MSPAVGSIDAAGPLAGMHVIEAGSFVAVPSGAMTLAMLGADVIRIDPIGGASDHGRAPRSADGTSLYWASLNKAKRSVTVDLRSPEGRELATAMITAPGDDRGLFVTNAIGRSWMSEATLRERRPDLVIAHLVGHPDGAAAVDYTVNWEVGFPWITGREHGPTMHALPAWDAIAGLHVATALLASERRRARTGCGDHIVVSLSDVALAVTDHLGYFVEVQVNGQSRDAAGDFVYGTFGTPFSTADGGSVMVVALTARHWEGLVGATGTAPVVGALEDHLGVDLADEHRRYDHRELLRGLFSPWFADRSTDEVLRVLDAGGVLASRLQSFSECFDSPRVQDNPLFRRVEHPRLGALLAAGAPVWFSEASDRPLPVAPVLGQHTAQVLEQVLGLSAAEIGDLHDRGIVATGTV